MSDYPFQGLPPRLNQAFDAEKSSGSSIWNNPITRRSFLKKSGGATVGAIVLSSILTDTAKAEIETWTTSDGTSISMDVDKEVVWCFKVKKEPDVINPDKVKKGLAIYIDSSDTQNNQGLTAWKNKDEFSGQSLNFPSGIGINDFFVIEDIEDAMYDDLLVASRFIASGPENGKYGSVTFGGNSRAYIFEEDGSVTDPHDIVAKADSTVGGATWTIDSKTGEITSPEAEQCVNATASTVGTGYAKFSVTLGKSVGTVDLGCSYLDGNVSWSVNGSGTGQTSKSDGKGGSVTVGVGVGGNIERKKFKWEGMSLTFKWKICKLKTETWKSKTTGNVVRIIETEFPITQDERGFAEEDDYAEPQ